MVGRIRVVKCPDIGPTTSTRFCPVTPLWKLIRVANGEDHFARSVTTTSMSPTPTEVIPNSGRVCVGRAFAAISHTARTCRRLRDLSRLGGNLRRAFAVSAEAVTAGVPSRRLSS